jgi:sulfur-carrier protein
MVFKGRAECPALSFFYTMPTVIIPALLRKHTGGAERVEVAGNSLREVVVNLDKRFPGIASQLLQDDDLKPSIAVSIDGEMATFGLLEKVGESSEVHFLPAIGGG